MHSRAEIEGIVNAPEPAPILAATLKRKRSSFPMTVLMEEQFAIRCERPLPIFGAKLCNRFVKPGRVSQSATRDSSGVKAQGISSSMRDCGWPFAIASRVAFIHA
jgi:hypothetical protein